MSPSRGGPSRKTKVVTARDLLEQRQGHCLVGLYDREPVEGRGVLPRSAPVEALALPVHLDDERPPAVRLRRRGEVGRQRRLPAAALLLEPAN
jgi:hypothetical protein